jgi:hypothetical protein
MISNSPLSRLKLLVAIGPVSWLVLGLYFIAVNHQMWAGLLALYYGLPMVALIHLVAPLGLLWVGRRPAPPAHRRWRRWGLVYYTLVPCLALGLMIWVWGLPSTLEAIAGSLSGIRTLLRRWIGG